MLHLSSPLLVYIHRENYCSQNLSSDIAKVYPSSAIPWGRTSLCSQRWASRWMQRAVVSVTELFSSFSFQLEGGLLKQPQACFISISKYKHSTQKTLQNLLADTAGRQFLLGAAVSEAAVEHCPSLQVVAWGRFGWQWPFLELGLAPPAPLEVKDDSYLKVYWQALEGLNVFFVAVKYMESCQAFRFEIWKADGV